MLRLLSMLQTHRYWSGSELAERLDVSERTLRRDVDRLRELGYPVNASRGVAGGYQLEAGGSLPPLLLDDDEAIAIAVGLAPGRRRSRQGHRGDVGPGPVQDRPDDAAAATAPDRRAGRRTRCRRCSEAARPSTPTRWP